MPAETVSTYPALWPTEEAVGFLDDKLQEAFNDLELVTHRMKEATRDDGRQPEPLPTLETVGVVWSFLVGLRLQLDQLGREANEVEDLLGRLDAIRLDHRTTMFSQRPEDA